MRKRKSLSLLRHDPRAPAWFVAAGVAVMLLGLAVRVVGLDVLPVFCDETLHIAWAGRAAKTGSLFARFESILLDEAWANGRLIHPYLLSFLPAEGLHSLTMCRLPSALLGTAAVAALLIAGRQLAGPTAGIVAGFIYSILPFAVVYDRLALNDAMTTALAAWIVVLSLHLATAEWWRWWQTVALAGLLLSVALVKPTGLMFFAFPGVALALLNPARRDRWLHFLAATGAATLVVAQPLALFFTNNIWDLSTQPATVDPLSNLSRILRWLWDFWTPPLAVLAIASTVATVWRRPRETGVLLAWTAIPVFAFTVIGFQLFPRYVLQTVIPVTLITASAAGRVIDRLAAASRSGEQRRIWALGVATAFAAVALWPAVDFDRKLLRDPKLVPFTPVARSQFVSGLPSGYAAREAAPVLRDLGESCPSGATAVVPSPFVSRTIDFYLRAEAERRVVLVSALASADDPSSGARQLSLAEDGCLFLVLADGSIAPRARRMTPELQAIREGSPVVTRLNKPDGLVFVTIHRVDPLSISP